MKSCHTYTLHSFHFALIFRDCLFQMLGWIGPPLSFPQLHSAQLCGPPLTTSSPKFPSFSSSANLLTYPPWSSQHDQNEAMRVASACSAVREQLPVPSTRILLFTMCNSHVKELPDSSLEKCNHMPKVTWLVLVDLEMEPIYL